MMESIPPGFLSRNVSSSYTVILGYKSSFYLSISIYIDQHKIIRVRLSTKCSQVLYIKVPEGKEGNLVYSSARLRYGSQWQNLFVQKEKDMSLVSVSTHVESCADEASKKMQQQEGFGLLTEIPYPAICEKAQPNFFLEEAYKCLVGN